MLFIVSCSNKNGDKDLTVPLFNDQEFKLYNGEMLSPVTSTTQKIYEKYFNNTVVQIPLFKHIKNNKYDIFIGIPVNTSVNEISKSVLEKHDSSLGNYKTENNFCYNQYNAQGLYLTEFAINVENKSLIFISSIAQSKIIADSLFSSWKLLQRIHKGKN